MGVATGNRDIPQETGTARRPSPVPHEPNTQKRHNHNLLSHDALERIAELSVIPDAPDGGANLANSRNSDRAQTDRSPGAIAHFGRCRSWQPVRSQMT